MRVKSHRRTFLIGFAVALGVALVGFLCLDAALGPLSRATFCARCHEMKDAHESWQQSPHHTNPSGVRVTCVACHLPPREAYVAHVTAKAWTGTRDVWQHFLGSYDAEAARRHVLSTLPSERCLHCHSHLAGAPSSSAVAIVHGAAVEACGSRGYACVVCHDALHGAKPKPTVEAKTYQEADNSYCYVCHIDFETEEFANAHLAAGVGCERCHGISEPHMGDEEGLTAPETMFPKDKVNPMCMAAECHPRERMEREIGHRPFFADADPQRKHCTDCHGKHRVKERRRLWDKKTGKLTWTDGTQLKRSGGM